MNKMKRQRQKIMTLKDEPPPPQPPPPDRQVSNMLLGKSGGQLLIAPERTKRLGLKQKCLSFVDVSGGESKVQCYKEQYCIRAGMLGPRNKVNWMWSKRRWQK